MFRLPAEVDPAMAVAALRQKGVFADCRGLTLRLSPGNVTTAEGVERLLKSLRTFVGKPVRYS